MRPEPRRLRELRWVIDNTIAAVGVDWSWPLSRVVLGATCAELHPQITTAIQHMKKLADISREFGKVAERSEAVARMAEGEGHFVTAREHYFSAANLYAAAQWPIWEDDHERNLQLGRKKMSATATISNLRPIRSKRWKSPSRETPCPDICICPLNGRGNFPVYWPSAEWKADGFRSNLCGDGRPGSQKIDTPPPISPIC
jgi:hypothetical protein